MTGMAGLHRPGDDQEDRVVDDLHRGDRKGVGGKRDRDHHGQRQARSQQRHARQGVAEEERQPDRQEDRGDVRPAERRPDRDTRNLADRAPGQAVQRGAERDSGEGRALRRHLMVMVGVFCVCFQDFSGHDFLEIRTLAYP